MAILYNVAGLSTQNWGNDLGAGSQKQRISEKWMSTADANITLVKHDISKVGSPIDNVTLSIYSGGSNPENGTLLGTSVVSGASLPTSSGTRTSFSFSPIAITNGTIYWFTWTRDTIVGGLTDLYTSSNLASSPNNGWVYVPLDGGWEALSTTTNWDIEIDTINSSSPSISPSSSSSISPSVSPSHSPSPSPSYGFNEHIVYLVASDIAGNVQLMNVGKSDDSAPIYYELETQDLEINSRGIIKAIKDKLGVASKEASGSHIEIIPNEEDAIELAIGMGKRVNVITLPSLKGYYIRLRWSGETTNKSPILEGFYLNKIESDGIHE